MSYKEFMRDRYDYAEAVPLWKGYVRTDFCRRQTIVAPIGFNILFYIMWAFFWWLRAAPAEFDRFRHQQTQARKDLEHIKKEPNHGR